MDNAHFHIAAGNFNSQNSVFQHWKNRKEAYGIEKRPRTTPEPLLQLNNERLGGGAITP